VEKSYFLKVAPYYYALGIIHHLQNNSSPTTESKIQQDYAIPDTRDNDEWAYFERELLFDQAVRFLVEHDIITVISDDFGPPILAESEGYYFRWQKLREDRRYPFYKYALASDGDTWVRQALQALDRQYIALNIQNSDFDDPPEVEWEPLPIDRDDPDLKIAVEKIDDTYEQVRADNGYAAHVPEERAYIMDSLGMVARKLKEASAISLPYLRRYAIDPLSMLIRRFGPSAIGLIATAAKEALKEWLKKRGLFLLDDL
jgi:hypothetical protein